MKIRLKQLVAISRIIILLLVVSLLVTEPVMAQRSYKLPFTQNDIEFYDPDAEKPQACAGGIINPGGEVPTDFNLGTDPKQRRINLMKVLIADYGFTPVQAAGPVGNFMHESAGTATVAKTIPPDVNQGETQGAPPKFSGGYGWAQWTGSRQRSFIDFAVDKKYMANENVRATDAADYAYLKEELNTGYKTTVTELKKQKTPEDAAVSFEATFEKAGKPALTERKANARQAYNEFMGGGENTPPGAPGPNQCVPGASTIVGEYAFPLQTTKNDIDNREIFRNNTTNTAEHPYTAYDILVDTGTPVVAFLGGTVSRLSEDRCGGRLIGVYNKESNLIVTYMHLDHNESVSDGDTVKAGDPIGRVGTKAHGCVVPHLHIDAAEGTRRPGCSRLDCPEENSSQFVDIGPQLYTTYQALPE